jgi:hypothetical protein
MSFGSIFLLVPRFKSSTYNSMPPVYDPHTVYDQTGNPNPATLGDPHTVYDQTGNPATLGDPHTVYDQTGNPATLGDPQSLEDQMGSPAQRESLAPPRS